jgi:hypothetical protein
MKTRIATVLLVCLAFPRAAYAQNDDPAPSGTDAVKEGREHFSRGLALYHEGNFGGARVEFQRAYDVAPSYKILFNLGQTAYELQDYAAAINAFSRYLAEGAAHVPAARRAEVEKSLRDLEQRVGRVAISTNVPGADVAIDGVHIGTTPLDAPTIVSVGRRSITATLAGRIPVLRSVDVAEGDHLSLSLDLVAPEPVPLVPVAVVPVQLPPAPPPVAAPPASVAPPRHASSTPMWIGVAATGALVATTAVFGGLTIGANNTYESRLGQFPGSTSGISDARSQVHTFALLADVFGGVAIASAGVTLYLGISRRDSRGAASVAVGPSRATLRVAF